LLFTIHDPGDQIQNEIDLQEVGWGYMDWIELAQERDRWWTLVKEAMNLRVLHKCGGIID
jgi:hypothetical protein